MAVDELLLERAIKTAHPDPIVRIYRWARPALSIGRHQRLSDESAARCLAMGVEVARRPTGGTAVLHLDDVTYSVVAPHGSLGVLEVYRWVARGLIAAMARLGLEAEVAEHAQRSRASAACFAASVGADLEVRGSKLCGSAQVRRKGWFLQHGSIPVSPTRAATHQLLEPSDDLSPWTCLCELRPSTTWDEVETCLTQGFSDVWGRYQAITSTPEALSVVSFGLDYACLTF
jgi:lipoate-protein ligase A